MEHDDWFAREARKSFERVFGPGGLCDPTPADMNVAIRALQKYRHCPHGVPDCSCTREAKRALERLSLHVGGRPHDDQA